MTDAPILLRDNADGVATLPLNRPQARNSLSSALLKALRATFADTYTREAMVKNLEAQDAQEGIGAFIDKRPPVWCGH